MASVKTGDGEHGKRNNFKKAAAHLLLYDPVAKKRTAGNKQGSAYISGLDGQDEAKVSGAQANKKQKPSIGKTGVHLRYHKQEEYYALMKEQKAELHELRKQNPD